MLQNLSEQIRLCYERAAEANQRAEEMTGPDAKADFLNIERCWLLLARSHQASESVGDFSPRPCRPSPKIVIRLRSSLDPAGDRRRHIRKRHR